MAATVFWAAACFAFPPAFARFALRAPAGSTRFFGEWACAGFCGAVTGSALAASGAGEWVLAAAWGTSGVAGLVLWWHSRRKGKRKALKAIGGKAKARLAAMLGNMPRPSSPLVLQRVPA